MRCVLAHRSAGSLGRPLMNTVTELLTSLIDRIADATKIGARHPFDTPKTPECENPKASAFSTLGDQSNRYGTYAEAL
jgi:hypothetical protein